MRLETVANIFAMLMCGWITHIAIAQGSPAKAPSNWRDALVQYEAKNLARDQLETDLLQALSKTAPNEHGEIYATLAKVFTRTIQPDETKVREYGLKALEFNIGAVDRIEVNIALGLADAVNAKQSPRLAEPRKQAATYFLRAFKLATDEAGPTADERIPSVSMFDYDGSTSDPAYQELMKQHEKELAARAAVMEKHKFQLWRGQMRQLLATLYSDSAVSLDELRELAKQNSLQQNDVDQIIAQVKSSRQPEDQ